MFSRKYSKVEIQILALIRLLHRKTHTMMCMLAARGFFCLQLLDSYELIRRGRRQDSLSEAVGLFSHLKLIVNVLGSSLEVDGGGVGGSLSFNKQRTTVYLASSVRTPLRIFTVVVPIKKKGNIMSRCMGRPRVEGLPAVVVHLRQGSWRLHNFTFFFCCTCVFPSWIMVRLGIVSPLRVLALMRFAVFRVTLQCHHASLLFLLGRCVWLGALLFACSGRRFVGTMSLFASIDRSIDTPDVDTTFTC